MNKKYLYISLVLVIALVYQYLNPRIEYKEKIVTKVQERVHVLTKTIERPDGTKITTTETKKDTDTSILSQKETKTGSRIWLISARMAQDRFLQGNVSKYGLQLSRSILGPVFIGVGIDTDKETSLILTYEF